MIKLLYPDNCERISIHTEVTKEFLYREAAGIHYASPERDRELVYSWVQDEYAPEYKGDFKNNPHEVNATCPVFINFTWKSDKPAKLVVSDECDLKSSLMKDYPAFPEACEILPPVTEDGISVSKAGQFFSDTVYYWKVVSLDGSEESEVRSFRTVGGYPRWIFAEGTANFRDLGGLVTNDGKRLKQGRIYRCAALDDNPDSDFLLTDRGIRVLRDVVKIKCELDIRKEAVGLKISSILGESVKYLQIVGRGYENFFIPEEREGRRQLIEALADENNYPICFHCAGGADRTGTLAFFLLALLGVPRELVVLDYNITSLAIVSKRRYGLCNEYDRFMIGYGGGDPTEYVKCRAEEYYIKECGGDIATLERLRNNLLEKITY